MSIRDIDWNHVEIFKEEINFKVKNLAFNIFNECDEYLNKNIISVPVIVGDYIYNLRITQIFNRVLKPPDILKIKRSCCEDIANSPCCVHSLPSRPDSDFAHFEWLTTKTTRSAHTAPNQTSEEVKMAAINVCLNILLGFEIGEF